MFKVVTDTYSDKCCKLRSLVVIVFQKKQETRPTRQRSEWKNVGSQVETATHGNNMDHKILSLSVLLGCHPIVVGILSCLMVLNEIFSTKYLCDSNDIQYVTGACMEIEMTTLIYFVILSVCVSKRLNVL